MARKSGLYSENSARLLEDASDTSFATLTNDPERRFRGLLGTMVYPVSATSSYVMPNLVLFSIRIVLFVMLLVTWVMVLFFPWRDPVTATAAPPKTPQRGTTTSSSNDSASVVASQTGIDGRHFFRMDIAAGWLSMVYLLLTLLISIHGHFSMRRTWALVANVHAAIYAAHTALPAAAAGVYFFTDWCKAKEIGTDPKTPNEWYAVGRTHFTPAGVAVLEFLLATVTPTLSSVLVVLLTATVYFCFALLSKQILGHWAYDYITPSNPDAIKFYAAGTAIMVVSFFAFYLLHIVRDVIFLPIRRRMLRSMDPASLGKL